MDISQTNNDELQKAIDNITKNAGIAPAPEAAAAKSELDAKIEDQLGVPPVPPMPPMDGGMPTGPEMTLPEMPEVAPEATSEPTPVEVNVPAEPAVTAEEPATTEHVEAMMPEMPTPAPVETEAPVEQPVDLGAPVTPEGLEGVRESMLRDLYPLMDKLELAPEQKWKIYHEMLDTTHDKSMISTAYAAVRDIADETDRAKALLYLVEQTEQ